MLDVQNETILRRKFVVEYILSTIGAAATDSSIGVQSHDSSFGAVAVDRGPYGPWWRIGPSGPRWRPDPSGPRPQTAPSGPWAWTAPLGPRLQTAPSGLRLRTDPYCPRPQTDLSAPWPWTAPSGPRPQSNLSLLLHHELISLSARSAPNAQKSPLSFPLAYPWVEVRARKAKPAGGGAFSVPRAAATGAAGSARSTRAQLCHELGSLSRSAPLFKIETGRNVLSA